MTQRHEDSDDDTYVRLGSAFEKLETVEDVEKAKRKKDKELWMTDEQGRRRFHGAFTGGFSAGYYNTVGSEEGWTPSTFISSKSKKSAYSGQRPEDFMDAEDLGDYGIAPRGISAKEPFNQKPSVPAQGPGRKRELESLRSVIPGAPALQNLIIPARTSIGAKLLKSMGWKEGEGVGPKAARYASRQGPKKVYGCSLPGQEQAPTAADSSYPEAAEGFLFAPSDVTPWEATGKDDMHGIGYRGMQEQHVLGARKATKALYGMSGEAFGIGALEDGEEEEDNVYGEETLTSYHSTLADDKADTVETTYGWTGKIQSGEWSLASFKKASKHTTNTKKYPPPDVPRDFVCKHKFGGAQAPPMAPPTTSTGAGEALVRQKPFTSTDRVQILSDKPMSVFSLLSESDRGRLKLASERAKGAGGRDDQGQQQQQQQQRGSRDHLEKSESDKQPVLKPAVGDTSKMKPFSRDPAKLARYEAYLAGKALPAAASGMTEWERQKEEEEFARAAKVFQPLSSGLSSRFTRAEEDGGKNKTSSEGKKKEPERPLTPESDAVQAAKAGMFGVLTRETQDWHPHRLLCKRFNVPDPYPNSTVVGVVSGRSREKNRHGASASTSRSISFIHTERILAEKDNASTDEPKEKNKSSVVEGASHMTAWEALTKPTPSTGPQKSLSVSHPSNTEGSSEVKLDEGKEEEVDQKENSKERPPMDLFKAIFADSSSESESSDDEEDSNQNNTTSINNQTNVKSTQKWQDLSAITSSSTSSSFKQPPKPLNQVQRSSEDLLTSAKSNGRDAQDKERLIGDHGKDLTNSSSRDHLEAHRDRPGVSGRNLVSDYNNSNERKRGDHHGNYDNQDDSRRDHQHRFRRDSEPMEVEREHFRGRRHGNNSSGDGRRERRPNQEDQRHRRASEREQYERSSDTQRHRKPSGSEAMEIGTPEREKRQVRHRHGSYGGSDGGEERRESERAPGESVGAPQAAIYGPALPSELLSSPQSDQSDEPHPLNRDGVDSQAATKKHKTKHKEAKKKKHKSHHKEHRKHRHKK